MPQMKFPTGPIASAAAFLREYQAASDRARESVDATAFAAACDLLAEAYRQDRMVFVCGNGGSTAIANHMVCDHGKLVASGTPLKPRVISLGHATEMITAVANDIGYDAIFAYQLGLLARKDDVLVIISGSGASPNVVKAMETAAAIGMRTLAMTAFDGGSCRRMADISLHVEIDNYGIAEDIHQSLMQMIAQYIRLQHMDPQDIPGTRF
jgi:D-sedoheptulose 7-phosphate isomerase